MKTVNCSYCGSQIPKKVSHCLNCGATNPKPLEAELTKTLSLVGVADDEVETPKLFNDDVFNTFQFVWGLGSFFGGIFAFAYFVTYWTLPSFGVLVLCILSSFFHLRTLWFIEKIAGRDV